jgi:VWFA-related protein
VTRLAAGLVVACSLAAGARSHAQSGQLPQPRFRTAVDVVEVSVLARDRAGRLVTDLTQADFRVLENGAPQQIVAFERVMIPAPAAAAVKATPPAARDVASNEHLPDARIYVLVLDSVHVASTRARNVRAFARQFIEKHVGPDDIVAVLSPGALDTATQDFTNDKSRLLAAVDQFTGSKMTSAILEIDQERRAAALGGGVMAHDGRDPSDAARANAAVALHSVLEAMASHLERIPGRRKSLLLFSEGIDYDLGDVMGTVQRQGSDVMLAMNRAMGALMRTNVSLYAIDPRALMSAEADLVATPLFQPGSDAIVTGRTFADEQSDSIRSLEAVAGATGGFAAVNGNQLTGAFERIVEESGTYYVVGYVSSKPPKPGEFRSIDVKVDRPDVRVTARRGYMAPRRDQARVAVEQPAATNPLPFPGGRGGGRAMAPPPAATTTTAATSRGPSPELARLLASPLPQPGLSLRVQAVPFRADGKKADVQLIVEVLGRTLTFVERGGRFEERIDVAMVTVDDRGRAGNGRSTAIDLRLPPDEFQRVKATGVRWLSTLELPAGRYQLRIAARAAGTGITGMLTHDVVVPKFQEDGVGLSAITLTSLPAPLMSTRGKLWLEKSLKGPPSASRVFVRGDRITAALEVYAPRQSRQGPAVIARVEGRDGSTVGTLERSQSAASESEAGFVIDTGALAPGAYLLRIIASSGGDTEERTVPFEIVAK